MDKVRARLKEEMSKGRGQDPGGSEMEKAGEPLIGLSRGEGLLEKPLLFLGHMDTVIQMRTVVTKERPLPSRTAWLTAPGVSWI